MQRVIAYIDSFNLYFGLKDKNWKKYYWLDLPALAHALLKPDQQLLATHYFTARIRLKGNNHSDMQRQTTYLEHWPLRKVLFFTMGIICKRNAHVATVVPFHWKHNA